MRKNDVHQCQCPQCQQGSPSPAKWLHAQTNLFLSTLDERQQRLFAGLESRRLGYGGDRQIALITGMSVHTIARGRQELAQFHPDVRLRQPGAGQPAIEKQDPSLLPALEQLLEDATAGNPASSLKWRRPSLRHLRDALLPNHVASAMTVRRLLHDLGYSPKVNRKQLGKLDPQRDEQFRYLHSQKALFLQHHWPVLSIDAKKRELIGWFKNPGTIWCREPCGVNIYDFRSLALGIGIPYGLYDIARNEGFVLVGTSGNTAEFAVDALSWWWRKFGCHHYPEATSLLLLADGGGNNGCRVRLWKYTLQHWFVNATGLKVTVCHYPTGASKWNPVEHRLFSQISDNWAGQPLDSYERMLHLIAGTTTEQGLVVHAALTKQEYATKIKISDEQMATINTATHLVFPQRNYTISPAIAGELSKLRECQVILLQILRVAGRLNPLESSVRSAVRRLLSAGFNLVDKIEPESMKPLGRALLPLALTKSANFDWLYGTVCVSPTIEKAVAKLEGKVIDDTGKVRKTTAGSKKTLEGGFVLWTGAWELNDLPPGTYTVELTALDKDGKVVTSRTEKLLHGNPVPKP